MVSILGTFLAQNVPRCEMNHYCKAAIYIFKIILFLPSATKAVIGWTALQNSIRIYFHQGEAIILHSKDWESEDMSEISQRLKAVTNGAPTQEFTLRRNQLGQLGFHVQHDGLITEVENFGYAWQTGLR